MCRPLTSLRGKGDQMQWSRTLRWERLVWRGWTAVFHFLWWHHQKDGLSCSRSAQVSIPATPASLHPRHPSTPPCSWLPWMPHSLPLSLQWFLLAGQWEAPNAEKLSRRNLQLLRFQDSGKSVLQISRSPDLQLWWFLFGDAQHLVGRFRLAGDPTQSIQMLSSHAASTTYQFYSPWELRAQTVITSCQIGFYTSYKVMF